MITSEAVLETLESTGTCSARLRCLHIPPLTCDVTLTCHYSEPQAATRPGHTLGGRQPLTAGSWQCQQRRKMTWNVKN